MKTKRYMANLPITDKQNLVTDYIINYDVLEKAKKLAEKSGHSLGQWVCKAINEEIKREGEYGNSDQ